MPEQLELDAEAAAAQLAIWADDPEGFVLDNFGLGYFERHGEELVLDPWQKEALAAVAAGDFVRFAFAASKNALKTCTLAWIAVWWIATREDAQIVVVSISAAQLKLGLWKEIAQWFGFSPLLQSVFRLTGSAIAHRDEKKRLTWWCEARSWAQDADATAQKETLAGLHGPAMMFLGDEAGGLPDGVVAAADAIFASDGGEARLVIAGNTVRQAGPLYRAVMNREGIWWVKRISGDPDDPQRCTRVKVQWAKEQLAMCGGDRNHPHYKINVLGEFPDIASDKLLGPDDVDRAMRRNPSKESYIYEPIIVGIDTALQGTDQTVLCRRQGPVTYRLRAWRTTDVMVLADQIAGELTKIKADAIFIDLGGPSGHGVRDRLKQLGFEVSGIDFGSEAVGDNPAAPVFANRRAEMAWKCAQWVKECGSLPEDQELRQELLEPNFWPAPTGKTRWLIEPKAAIKERLSRSPDRCDSLWLTWAAPVALKRIEESAAAIDDLQRGEFNPFDHMSRRSR